MTTQWIVSILSFGIILLIIAWAGYGHLEEIKTLNSTWQQKYDQGLRRQFISTGIPVKLMDLVKNTKGVDRERVNQNVVILLESGGTVVAEIGDQLQIIKADKNHYSLILQRDGYKFEVGR